MSQLLTRILKPHIYKKVMRHNNNNKMVRLFSSSMQMIYPYVLIDQILKIGKESRWLNGDYLEGRIERGLETSTIKQIVIKDKELEEEIRDAMNVGYYQNDSRFQVSMYSDTSYLSNIDNVRLHLCVYSSNPNLSPKELRLPYLPTGTQIQNVAMSSSGQRDEDTNIEDLVVAVKLSGSQLKVYRLASHDHDFRWIDIQTIHESISPFSSLMYSKKDRKFYVPTPGGEYLCSFDLNVKKKDKPELVRLWTNPIPLSLLYNLSQLIQMTRTDHLVESPYGQQFLIKWYYGDHLKFYDSGKLEHKTERFMVFKEEGPSTDKKGKMMSYTEDIGDLCIFLGRNEASCLQASSTLVFDITTQTCTLFTTDEGSLRSTDFPYWPHPLSMINSS
ncbi:hypothetical protein EUTSA_v10001172mg [Eutrema salsugineum]|uniref:KIB1-4 beta-propeller domain-containing protein n=1 Tax=Eutrema salsugineum TaxID=72664 RepID=V4N3B2_EUTSA|nr:hypothetical protein EUTSA_v10001172mg [Eutrema salsugineum]